MKHVSIKISGKVQGVFFRASAKSVADKLGVKGYVRNEPNGDVYLEAEANEEVIDQFIEWCKQGPTRAHVTSIKVAEKPVTGATTFEITR